MTFISYEEAQVDAETGLIGYAEMLHQDQKDEEVEQLDMEQEIIDELYDKHVRHGEQAYDYERGN